MRLLYLEVNDGGRFKDLVVSFDKAYRFVRKGNFLTCDFSNEETLPGRFFTVCGADKAVVSDLFAIVGENGSGKTSIARFLQQIRASDVGGDPGFEYVLIYEVVDQNGPVWRVHWCLRDIEGPIAIDTSKFPKGIRLVLQTDKDACHPNAAFEFAYYTPHLTPENLFGASGHSMGNLSPNGLLSGANDGEETTLSKFVAAEHRRVLEFLHDFDKACSPENRKLFGLPFPHSVTISLHRPMLADTRLWLSERKRVVTAEFEERKRNDEQLSQSAVEQYNRLIGEIQEVEDLLVPVSELSAKPARTLLADVFALFMVNMMRSSHYLELAGGDGQAWYAGQLKGVYTEVVLNSMEADGEKLDEFFRKLKECLKAIVKRTPVPGMMVEEPWEIETRVAFIDVVDVLMTWIKRQARDLPIASVIQLDIPYDDEQLKTFVLKYASTIGRYDYLFLEFDPRLSAGEMSYLQLFSRVYSYFGSIEFGRKVKDEEPWRFKDLPPLCDARLYQYDVLLFMDEVETTLHPRLQAKLVRNLLLFFQLMLGNYRVHLVLATHSPILLSDIPKSHVLFLKADKSIPDCYIRNTFAANVFDLYNESFFMTEGTVGAFAAEKVNRLLKLFSARLQPGADMLWFRKDVPPGKIIGKEDLRVAEMIGDDFVYRYVWARLDALLREDQLESSKRDEKTVD